MEKKKEGLAVTDQRQERFLATYDPEKSIKLEVIAEKLNKSGMFPHIKNGMQAFSIVEYGYELGIPPMAALQSMAIVSGKLCAEGKLMLAQYIRAGGNYQVLTRTKEKSAIKWSYRGQEGVTEFTTQDAQRIGLLVKDNWRKYPEEMLFWRNVAKGIRAYAPDVMLFAQTVEEATQGAALTVDDLMKKESKPLAKNAVITEDLTVAERPNVIDVTPEAPAEPEPETTQPDESTPAASEKPDTGKPAEKQPEGTVDNPFVDECEECGEQIDSKVAKFSKSRFNKKLCRDCQKNNAK
ncbi:MAG: hypothetical protein PHF74_05715 [Dehalococcoidales bacterium]|nr:hypothetical protein [Dehalococcoidales bacterium]